jgi:hypothetical protein
MEYLAWSHETGPYSDSPMLFVSSGDAITWKLRSKVSSMTDHVVQQIVADGDRLVAVGFELLDADRAPRAWTSLDGGRTWDAADVPAGSYEMHAVRREGSVLIARGEAYPANPSRVVSWISADGMAWTMLPDDEDLPSITYFSPGMRVTVGDRVCVVGTFFRETAENERFYRGAIYCRSAIAR